jgi:hypothetical protein
LDKNGVQTTDRNGVTEWAVVISGQARKGI